MSIQYSSSVALIFKINSIRYKSALSRFTSFQNFFKFWHLGNELTTCIFGILEFKIPVVVNIITFHIVISCKYWWFSIIHIFLLELLSFHYTDCKLLSPFSLIVFIERWWLRVRIWNRWLSFENFVLNSEWVEKRQIYRLVFVFLG